MYLKFRFSLRKLFIVTFSVFFALVLYVLFKQKEINNVNLVKYSKKANIYSVNTNNYNQIDKTLESIFISIKTAKIYHNARIPVILKTWFQQAKNQTWFFTDSDDLNLQTQSEGHMINTNCSLSYNRLSLCCKMSVEFDMYMESNKRWFCHFDDDNYVNIDGLTKFLSQYNSFEDWYLGRPSIERPIEIFYKRKIQFWFATGGAGFCISRALALKMLPFTSNGRFISISEKIRLPDDVTIGFIIGHLLSKPLTIINQFHSHLESLKFITKENLQDQISFSYLKTKNSTNIVNVDGFSLQYDPNRFLSIHCILYPNTNFCL